MEKRVFARLLICVVAVCLLLTLAHLIYAFYAYEHCSIIQWIAKELW